MDEVVVVGELRRVDELSVVGEDELEASRLEESDPRGIRRCAGVAGRTAGQHIWRVSQVSQTACDIPASFCSQQLEYNAATSEIIGT